VQNAGLGSPLESLDHSQPPANERIEEARAWVRTAKRTIRSGRGIAWGHRGGDLPQ